MEHLDSFKIIGISVETTNENNQSVEDIGKLWQRLYGENISEQIPNKVSDEIYSIYTDYKSDYRGEYLSLIGFKVKSLDSIPEGMVGREFAGGNYIKFIAKGEMPNAIMDAWKQIWDNDGELDRMYTADFEIYGEKSQKGNESEVEIFIATKNE